MSKTEQMKQLREFAAEIRLETLRILKSHGRGHLGGSMSIADAFAVLYGAIMKVDPKNPQWEERDWCVLSKGHAGPVMYATLGVMGYFNKSEAYTLNHADSAFPSHTDHLRTTGVELTTGSLGQGISEAVGAALAMKLQKKDNRVYVIVGDGEADEGEVWEAAQFAAHYHLDHLIALVDNNGRQLDGSTEEIMSHAKGIGAKFDAFGWNVIDVKDGNDVEEIYDALSAAKEHTGSPSVLILHTVKGKGVEFAEKSGAHSSTLSAEGWDEEIQKAEARLHRLQSGEDA